MNDISLSEAWSLWFSGQMIQNYKLWGLEIIWWGRIGKIVTLLSAMTIILDIIGSQKIRIFGNGLHKAFDLKKVHIHMLNGFKWYLLMIEDFFYEESDFELNHIELLHREASEYKADKINLIINLLLTIIFSIFSWPNNSWWFTIFLAIIFFLFGWYLWAPILTIVLITIFLSIGSLIDIFLIEPIAWILEREKLEKGIKIASLLFLFLGFHFDLLAS